MQRVIYDADNAWLQPAADCYLRRDGISSKAAARDAEAASF